MSAVDNDDVSRLAFRLANGESLPDVDIKRVAELALELQHDARALEFRLRTALLIISGLVKDRPEAADAVAGYRASGVL